jgi:protein gp37
MQRTKIEWADYTWNPIKGLCPVGCWYCYARKIYQRFKKDPKISFNLYNPGEIERLQSINPKPGAKIFVCSTMELFHPKVLKKWRDDIFLVIKTNPKLIFIILTKMPERIDRSMPDNVWLGVTLEGSSDSDITRALYLDDAKAKIKFISFEPLLERPWPAYIAIKYNWIIIGRLTGHGKIHDPKREWLEEIIYYTLINHIPIFIKNNLEQIWTRDPYDHCQLIQEYPKKQL